MKKIYKAAIVSVTLSVAVGYFIYVNKIITWQESQLDHDVAPPDVPEVEMEPEVKHYTFHKKERDLKQYAEGPNKTFCNEFVKKAVPSILLKGPDAIDKRNEDKFRCRALFPAATALTEEELTDAREEVFVSCMEKIDKTGIKPVRDFLATIPLDCDD